MFTVKDYLFVRVMADTPDAQKTTEDYNTTHRRRRPTHTFYATFLNGYSGAKACANISRLTRRHLWLSLVRTHPSGLLGLNKVRTFCERSTNAKS